VAWDQGVVTCECDLPADGLPGQILPGAQLAQGLSVVVVEAVRQAPPAWVGQRPEDLVHAVLSASWR
jgi:hypothetical protein